VRELEYTTIPTWRVTNPVSWESCALLHAKMGVSQSSKAEGGLSELLGMKIFLCIRRVSKDLTRKI
jgi:hypothetical protein